MGYFEVLADLSRQEGIEEGMEKGMEKATENSVYALLEKTDFSTEKIADVLGVSVAFVEKVAKKLRGA